MNLQGGQYGIASIYSTPKTMGFTYNYNWNNQNRRLFGGESRVMLGTKHSIGKDKSFWFVNTHLAYEMEGQIASRQLLQLVTYLKSLDSELPIVLVGDFNITKQHINAHKIMSSLLIDEDNPTGFRQVSECADEKCIDRIFLYDPSGKIKVNSTGIIKQTYKGIYVSDHTGVYVKFEWAD